MFNCFPSLAKFLSLLGEKKIVVVSWCGQCVLTSQRHWAQPLKLCEKIMVHLIQNKSQQNLRTTCKAHARINLHHKFDSGLHVRIFIHYFRTIKGKKKKKKSSMRSHSNLFLISSCHNMVILLLSTKYREACDPMVLLATKYYGACVFIFTSRKLM